MVKDDGHRIDENGLSKADNEGLSRLHYFNDSLLDAFTGE